MKLLRTLGILLVLLGVAGFCALPRIADRSMNAVAAGGKEIGYTLVHMALNN